MIVGLSVKAGQEDDETQILTLGQSSRDNCPSIVPCLKQAC